MRKLLLILLLLGAVPARAADPAAAVEALLAADRAFAAAARERPAADAIGAMFDAAVVVPQPDGRFVEGKAAALAALRANPFNLAAHAEWRPLRAGISADGRHGFSFGYMTMAAPGGEVRLLKYLAYWVKRPEGWRVALYRRSLRAAGEETAAMPPSLPGRAFPGEVEAHRRGLAAAETAFSDEAQRIGLGPAFARYGAPDAVNLGREAGFVLGAEAIARSIDPGYAPPSPVSWGPDGGVLVAGSGDLGATWGHVRSNGPVPEGQPASFPFITIWRRGADGNWRYVAE
ncbi:MAG: YybH family protein [Allosphingosinicella sp.]|uniref:YybH family protein n=1 Tax=Allosphingosinicella sp. TaxID=2823234 RepID=UPI003962D750